MESIVKLIDQNGVEESHLLKQTHASLTRGHLRKIEIHKI
jgi:hypothetical protein